MRRLIATLLITGLVVSSSAAVAAAGGRAKPVGGGSSGSSLELVLLDSPDGTPNHGERITFLVTTAATTRPFVRLLCHQGGALVGSGTVGYFDGYPWAQEFTLGSTTWSSGAADCRAELYMSKDGRRTTTLAAIAFHVDA